MKRLSICSSLACLTFLIVGFAPERSMAQAGDVVVHAATVDLTHNPGTEPVDQIDMTASFTNNEFKELRKCEPAESLIQHGVRVGIQPGLCGSGRKINNITIPFFHPLFPGSNVASFEGLTAEKATADAVLRTLKRIPGTCGTYSLRVDAVNVNLANVKNNPVAVTVTLPDGSSGCLTINNALIDQ
jgi:hypothetical protein